jgi:hypothetical protein
MFLDNSLKGHLIARLMEQACKSSYLRDWDWKAHPSLFEASPGKKLVRAHLSKQAGGGGTACNPNYVGGVGRRIKVQSWPWGESMSPYLKYDWSKKGLEVWLKW